MSRVVTYTTAGTCACCTGRTAAALDCRTQGGTAALCGYAEYTGVSTPPKRYLKRTLSGTSVGNLYSVGNCTGTLCTATDTYAGDCSYSASTCAVVTAGTFHRDSSPGGCSTSPDAATCDIGAPFTAGGDSYVLTQTTRSMTNDGVCHNIGGGFRRGADSRTETLSIEDTEGNAITRLLAATTFSAWAACVTYATCCKADYEQRTTSVSFNYHTAQYRVRATITPSTFAYSNVYLYRRVYGTVTWSPFALNVESGTSSVTGLYLTSGTTIPNTLGYETYAGPAFMV